MTTRYLTELSRFDLHAYQGARSLLTFDQFIDPDTTNPIDLTGALSIQLRLGYRGEEAILQKSPTKASANGELEFTLTEADTLSLKVKVHSAMVVIVMAGEVYVVAEGTVDIKEQVLEQPEQPDYVELLAGQVANDPDVLLMLAPAWEGGAAPNVLTARAQHPGLGDGDAVVGLTDWSSYGNHPTQADPGKQPVFDEDSGSIVLDGSDMLTTPDIELDYQTWVYAVVQWEGALNTQGFICEHGDDSANTPGFGCAVRYGTGFSGLLGYPKDGAALVAWLGVLSSVLPTGFDRLEYVGDPTPLRKIVRNDVEATPTGNVGTQTNQANVQPLHIGARNGPLAVEFGFTGKIRYLVVAKGDLSNQLRQSIIALGAAL